MKKLKALINGKWEYVFCRNELLKYPVTTADKSKAIKGDDQSLKYFERFFPEIEFKCE